MDIVGSSSDVTWPGNQITDRLCRRDIEEASACSSSYKVGTGGRPWAGGGGIGSGNGVFLSINTESCGGGGDVDAALGL